MVTDENIGSAPRASAMCCGEDSVAGYQTTSTVEGSRTASGTESHLPGELILPCIHSTYDSSTGLSGRGCLCHSTFTASLRCCSSDRSRSSRRSRSWPISGRSFFMLLRRANAIIFRKQRNYCCCLSIFSLNNV